RRQLLDRYGGNERTEIAVDDALAWLAAHQDPIGRWDADGFTARCPRGDECEGAALETGADTGVTGLALLAFLGAGHVHDGESRHAETVRKGLNWLLKEMHPDGDLRGRRREGRVYSHAIATLAIAEALQLSDDERLRPYAARAVAWLVRAQNPDTGGWRYLPREDSDTSVWGWCVLALASARQAGIEVPESAWRQAQSWITRIEKGASGGLASYQPAHAPSAAMTAETLVCRQLFGEKRNSDAAIEAAIYLLQQPPNVRQPNFYYWYYGTVALFQVGGVQWERWNDSLQGALLGAQRRQGHLKGSWDPQSPVDHDGGRIYSTAIATLSLEVYYRHLPLYKDSPGR
ncbi:MAG TPA: prenyltransferase/squalene oxidase repeat-containing protein, partial [Planctomycetia bacterium]|nr:prenyltransferase/squalene oxidase repeat-containing protein [Planctomycetia bacterium]